MIQPAPLSSVLLSLRFRSKLSCLKLSLILFALCNICGCQILGKRDRSMEPEYVANPCVILALPNSGPYAPISAKIKKGAEIARSQLASTGSQVRIAQIDTDSPTWLTQLAALPAECAVVGGPLREQKYLEARKAGLTTQRVFFAFMPALQQGDEGINAWRFFPSPQDQIDTLVKFAADDMNLRTFGALLPDDNYGKRMTALLEESLRKKQIPLQKATYSKANAAAISNALKPLINPSVAADRRTLIPQTTFEALFLPDSWKRVDMITTSLQMNGEDRLALLGTTLWEQGLTGKQVPMAQKFSLAVFPGAWNKNRAPAALRAQNNDFWSALGYDFINFATSIALAVRPDMTVVTKRAQKASQAIKAMAPIIWENSGKARQQLYLFQISPQGSVPLDAERFKQSRTAIAERAALRMQGINAQYSQNNAESEPVIEAGAMIEEPAAPEVPVVAPARHSNQPINYEAPVEQNTPVIGTQVPTPQPAQAPAIMSTVPRSSYKLSLPGK